jgi:hypothetical protein
LFRPSWYSLCREMSTVWTRFYRGLSACFRRFTDGRTKRLGFNPFPSNESVIRCGARGSSALEPAHPLGVGFLFTAVGGDVDNPFEWFTNKVASGLKGMCLRCALRHKPVCTLSRMVHRTLRNGYWPSPQRIACSYMRDTVVLSYVCGTFTRPYFLHPGPPPFSWYLSSCIVVMVLVSGFVVVIGSWFSVIIVLVVIVIV